VEQDLEFSTSVITLLLHILVRSLPHCLPPACLSIVSCAMTVTVSHCVRLLQKCLGQPSLPEAVKFKPAFEVLHEHYRSSAPSNSMMELLQEVRVAADTECPLAFSHAHSSLCLRSSRLQSWKWAQATSSFHSDVEKDRLFSVRLGAAPLCGDVVVVYARVVAQQTVTHCSLVVCVVHRCCSTNVPCFNSIVLRRNLATE